MFFECNLTINRSLSYQFAGANDIMHSTGSHRQSAIFLANFSKNSLNNPWCGKMHFPDVFHCQNMTVLFGSCYFWHRNLKIPPNFKIIFKLNLAEIFLILIFQSPWPQSIAIKVRRHDENQLYIWYWPLPWQFYQ